MYPTVRERRLLEPGFRIHIALAASGSNMCDFYSRIHEIHQQILVFLQSVDCGVEKAGWVVPHEHSSLHVVIPGFQVSDVGIKNCVDINQVSNDV